DLDLRLRKRRLGHVSSTLAGLECRHVAARQGQGSRSEEALDPQAQGQGGARDGRAHRRRGRERLPPPPGRPPPPPRRGRPRPPAGVGKLRAGIEAAGGHVLSAYRDPLGGHWLVSAALPLERVKPTPYQRELSKAHAERLATVIPKVGRFLDPVIAVPEGDHY